MAYERLWAKVQQSFTADGGLDGGIQVANPAGFFVTAYVQISSNALQPRNLQIKKIVTETLPYTIYVGPLGEKQSDINARTPVNEYLLADGAQILQPEQKIGEIKEPYVLNNVYERDPVKAFRVENVDPRGNPIDSVTGSDGLNRIAVDAEVSVDLQSIGLFDKPYDTIGVTYPSAVVEQYQSYLGGLTGTPVQLVTVTYTDSTKNSILSVVRTPYGP